jgi:hypothetical protein
VSSTPKIITFYGEPNLDGLSDEEDIGKLPD